MKRQQAQKIIAWLQQRPTLDELRQAYPAQWQMVETRMAEIIASGQPEQLDQLLRPESSLSAKKPLDNQQTEALLMQQIRQRMAALLVQRYSLAAASGVSSGKVRFNLFNGWIAQKLLFARHFQRKPVSMFWFRLLWPLLWQRRRLMPLVQAKGIYCFYSRPLIDSLRQLIGNRSCLEIAAGDGTLTRFLADRGCNIIATDDHSWQHKVSYAEHVRKLDAAQALQQHAPEVVICSWPPAANPFERHVFKTASVQLYIVIGSVHRIAAGNWEDYAAQTQFSLEQDTALSRLVLPPELGAAVYLFRRKAA